MSDEFAPVLYLDHLDEGSSARYSDEEIAADYRQYREHFQPFRLVLKSEGNNEPLMWGESYFNRADAEHTARLVGSAETTVFLRQQEHGNVLLRQGVTA